MDRTNDRLSEKLFWIKDLVRAEDQMEQSGMVDLSIGLDSPNVLQNETLRYLLDIKNHMIEAATAFNEIKSSPLGRIKIYGVAKTQADFMLFRNGYKMIFSVSEPGGISIRFNFMGPSYIPSTIPTLQQNATPALEENRVVARRGPFQDLVWTFQEHPVQLQSLVRYHLTMFIKENAK
jgi:hypothetical protein